MATQNDAIDGNYTRKSSGKRYDYQVAYSTGPEVVWDATVWCEGDLKGAPNGLISNNQLTGVTLRDAVTVIVESYIEQLVGVSE